MRLALTRLWSGRHLLAASPLRSAPLAVRPPLAAFAMPERRVSARAAAAAASKPAAPDAAAAQAPEAAASPKKAAPKKASAKRKASPPAAEATEQPEPSAPAASPRKKKAKAAAAADASDEPEEAAAAPRKKKGKAAAAADASDEPGEAAAAPRKKKGKAAADPDAERHPSAPLGGAALDTLAAEGLPRNADMPQELSYAPRPEGRIRIASWNITSLASAEKKGMLRYLMAEDADIVVLTETKVNDVPRHPALLAKWPHQTWGIGAKKGYAGIALLSKIEPLRTSCGLPGDLKAETKGRVITAEYDKYILVGTYVVNAGEGLKTMPEKQAWNAAFAAHVAECDSRKPVIWCGDLNVVIDHRDLASASKKWDKSPGYTEIECEAHRKFLAGEATSGAQPFVDVWREKHPDAVGHYSFYGFRGMCRAKGIGWRLDSFIVSKRAADAVQQCEIRHEAYGASDHVPVIADVVW